MKPNPLDEAVLSGFHKRIALDAAGGPFLDGYILSSTEVALVTDGPEFGLSTVMTGLIGAAALAGRLFGGVLSGFLTDRFGRQVMFTLDLGLTAALPIRESYVRFEEYFLSLSNNKTTDA